jgi:hypothetical protein
MAVRMRRLAALAWTTLPAAALATVIVVEGCKRW